MATEKILGKITRAEFGRIPDHEYLMGLKLDFKLGDGSHIGDGGKYAENMAPSCEWPDDEDRTVWLAKIMDIVYKVLSDANVNEVSKLVGKPVEVTIVDSMFYDFRILTEVL